MTQTFVAARRKTHTTSSPHSSASLFPSVLLRAAMLIVLIGVLSGCALSFGHPVSSKSTAASGPVLIADSTIEHSGGTFSTLLNGIDAATGHILWSKGSSLVQTELASGDAFYMTTYVSPFELKKMQARNGGQIWSINVASPVTLMSVQSALLYGYTNSYNDYLVESHYHQKPSGADSSLLTFDTNTGKTQWQTTLAGKIEEAQVANGTVYCVIVHPPISLTSFTASLVAISATNHRILWQLALDTYLPSLYIDGNVVYLSEAPFQFGTVSSNGTETDTVRALNAITGQILWQRSFTSDVNGAAIVAGQGVVCVQLRTDIQAIRESDGSPLWLLGGDQSQILKGLGKANAFTIRYDQAADGKTEGEIDTISLKDGSSVWVAIIAEGSIGSFVPTAETIYISTLTVGLSTVPTVQAVNVSDGSIRWKTSLSGIDSSIALAS